MVGMQKIQTVGSNRVSDSSDIAYFVDPLAEDGSDNRFAGAVKHWTDQAGD